MIGQNVGSYRIVRELGAGAMGAVYEGVDLMLERPVAIKMLRAEIARQPELIERFRVEAVTLARLNHPNIATLYAFFRERDEYYMVMEFVRGQTLERLIQISGRLAPGQAGDILRQTLDGMAHAHALGILHRDIKPANIMVTPEGTVKVTDFGIARLLGSSRMTREGRIIGTLEYIAPERIRGEEADIRSDLYSAGVVLYEGLAGRLPFVSDTDFALIEAHLKQAPPALRELSVDCPPALEAAVRRALAKSPADRYPSAEEFGGALAAALPQRGTRSAVSPGGVAYLKPTRLAGSEPALAETRLAGTPAPPALAFFRKLPPRWLAAAGGLVLVAGLFGLFGLFRHHAKPLPPAPTPVSDPDPVANARPAAKGEEWQTPEQLVAATPAARGGGSSGSPGNTPQPFAPTPAPAAEKSKLFLPGEATTQPAPALRSPRSIQGVRKIYIERMSDRMDELIAAEIRNQLPGRLTVVADRGDADAIMIGSSEKYSGSRFKASFHDEVAASVTITDKDGAKQFWTSQAGDRQQYGVVVKHGGAKKVAERLVSNLRKALEKD
jgi:serine/threonine-protein kinase